MSWHKPETHTTPSEGSVHDEGASEPLAVGRELCDRLKRINDAIEQEPVAWAVWGGGYGYVSLLRESAEEAARSDGGTLITLYAAPQDRVVRLPKVVCSCCAGAFCESLDAAGVKWEVADE